jgi:hypothetical protein
MGDYDAFDSAAPSQIEKLLLAPHDYDSAVVSRSTVKFRPQGTSVYNDSARTMQFRLSSSDYLDMSTLKFGFKLTRAFSNQIQEDMYALSCIQDIRVEAGGVTVEDIRGVNRCLKPLIYCGVDADYLRGDLTQAGSYKYVPSHVGVFSTNVGASEPQGQTSQLPTAGNPPVTASDVQGSLLRFAPTINGLAPISVAGTYSDTGLNTVFNQVVDKVNTLIAQRDNSPYSVYLAHPADSYGFEQNSAGSASTPVTSDGIPGLDLAAGDGIYVPSDSAIPTVAATKGTGGKSTNSICNNNYTCGNYLGKAVRPNSMPIDYAISPAFQNDAVTTHVTAGMRAAKGTKLSAALTQDYSFPMHLVLGICRISSYLPVRNLGSLLLELTLAPYNQQFIHVYPMFQDSSTATTQVTQDHDAAKANATAMASSRDYSITAPYMQCDAVRCSDAVVARVDEMCASSSGYSLPFESYSTLTTPFAYTSQLSLTYSRAFSKLKSVHVSFQQQESASNLHLSKSDYYMGSRYRSHRLTVGSTSFPLVDCDTPSEAYSELQKSLSHLGTTRGSVVDRKTWLGERADFAENQFSVAGFMPDIVTANAGGLGAMRAATGLPTQASSCALWGVPLERVLTKGGSTYGSGISTRASGMQVQADFQFQDWTDTDWMTGTGSLMDPKYLDAHLGNSRMLAYTVFHIDGLLRISNDAVSVSI